MIDTDAFIAGINKQANDLYLTAELRAQVVKLAGIFNSSDSLQSIQDGLDRSIELKDVAGHSALHGLPYAGIGGGLGGIIGDKMTEKDKYKSFGHKVGAGVGSAVGQGVGMVNDLRNLGNNERELKLDNLLKQLGTTPSHNNGLFDDSENPRHQMLIDAIKRTKDDSWYDAFIPSD